VSDASAATLGSLAREGAVYLESRDVPSASFDARVLLAHALGISRSELLSRLGEPAPDRVRGRFREYLERRGGRVPLQHITAAQEFWSLEFEITPAVLIPRPETELVVEEALRLGASSHLLADIGTGSGNIAVALARGLPAAKVFASDVSSEALQVARRNAARHGVASRVEFLLGDLAAPLEKAVEPGSLDLLVSNPPYVSAWELASLEPEVRDHEPRLALTPMLGDGLSLYPALLDAAVRFLRPGGHVILELPWGGADRVPGLMAGKDALELLTVRSDYSGTLRVLVARRR
jgi:release factor glutamine methyltransferase